MKFLILWSIQSGLQISSQLVKSVLDQVEYVKKLESEGRIEKHYHIVGRHGGVWIVDVNSNEELERLLASSPAYNFSQYEIYPLAETPGAMK